MVNNPCYKAIFDFMQLCSTPIEIFFGTIVLSFSHLGFILDNIWGGGGWLNLFQKFWVVLRLHSGFSPSDWPILTNFVGGKLSTAHIFFGKSYLENKNCSGPYQPVVLEVVLR